MRKILQDRKPEKIMLDPVQSESSQELWNQSSEITLEAKINVCCFPLRNRFSHSDHLKSKNKIK